MKNRVFGTRQNLVTNSVWLFAERLVQMAVALVITTWIARSLGPLDFGKLSYATTFIAFFLAASTLSLDGLIVRDASKAPDKASSILGSAYAVRFTAGSLAWISATAIYLVSFPHVTENFWILVLIGSTLVTQAFQVVDLWFQSQYKAYLGVSARLMALFLSAAIKVALIAFSAPVLLFALAQGIESLLIAISLLIVYKKHPCETKLMADWTTIRSLLTNGWPLALSGVGITIYMKIDQFAVGSILGQEALGIYASAIPIVQGLAVLPTVISSIAFPRLVRLRRDNNAAYKKRAAELVRYTALGSLIICIIISEASPLIIHLLYGNKFEAAAPILSLMVFNNFFVSIGAILGVFGLNESLQKISLLATSVAATSAIILSSILIPNFGLYGAAYAALVSNFISVVAIPLAVSKEYRTLYIHAFLFKLGNRADI